MSLIACAKVRHKHVNNCLYYITLHSLDCHVRDVTQKVHLMSISRYPEFVRVKKDKQKQII